MKEKRNKGEAEQRSKDLRLGDALVGLPCLKRQRALSVTGPCLKSGGGQETNCPVCGVEAGKLAFPSESGEGRRAVARVREMFPGWQPEDGLCGPCLERFGKPLL